jgi:hypothetical protein
MGELGTLIDGLGRREFGTDPSDRSRAPRYRELVESNVKRVANDLESTQELHPQPRRDPLRQHLHHARSPRLPRLLAVDHTAAPTEPRKGCRVSTTISRTTSSAFTSGCLPEHLPQM